MDITHLFKIGSPVWALGVALTIDRQKSRQNIFIHRKPTNGYFCKKTQLVLQNFLFTTNRLCEKVNTMEKPAQTE